MKKILPFLLSFLGLFIFSENSHAQRSLGLGASYSTGLQATGIHLRFNTSFSEKLGSTVEFENYFMSGENKWQTVGLQFSYNIIQSEDFNFYLLGGGHFFIYTSEDVLVTSGQTYNGATYSTDFTVKGADGSEIGGRLGVGLQKSFNNQLLFFAETKITFNPKILDLTTFFNLTKNQIIPTVGLAYQF